MRASKDPPTILELCNFFQEKRAHSLTPTECHEGEEASNSERTQPSSRTRTETTRTIGQAVNRPEISSPSTDICIGSRGGDSCFLKAARNVPRDGKNKYLNFQSLENRSKRNTTMAPHQPHKKPTYVVDDHNDEKEIGGPSEGIQTNQAHRKMRSASNTVKLPPIQQPAKNTATPSCTVKPEGHSKYSEDEELPGLKEKRLSSRMRTEKAAVTTTEQAAYRPRTGRLVLVMAQKRTSNDDYEYKPRAAATTLSKSRFILPALTEAPPLRTEDSDGSRSEAYSFEVTAANDGRDGNKHYYLRSAGNRSRRVAVVSWCQPQDEAPDVVHDTNEGKEKHKMVAIGGPPEDTQTNQGRQRKMSSAGHTVKPQPIKQPAISSRSIRTEESDAIKPRTKGRRFGRQEAYKEASYEQSRRQGVCVNTESADRTFLRVLNKRF